MKKLFVSILIAQFLWSCGQQNKEKIEQSENKVKQSTISTTLKEETDSLSELMNFRKESLDSEYKDYQIYNLNEIISEDFNGDGVIDKAEFKKQKNSGIIITDGKTHIETRLGFGKKFAHMTDFDWVSFWGILKDKTTFEITFDNKTGDILGDSIVTLKYKSIFVIEDEVGGGVITYENNSYKWIHQSD